MQHTILLCPTIAKKNGGVPWAGLCGSDAMSRLKPVEIMLGPGIRLSEVAESSRVPRRVPLFDLFIFTETSTSCDFRLRRGQDRGLVGSLDPVFEFMFKILYVKYNLLELFILFTYFPRYHLPPRAPHRVPAVSRTIKTVTQYAMVCGTRMRRAFGVKKHQSASG